MDEKYTAISDVFELQEHSIESDSISFASSILKLDVEVEEMLHLFTVMADESMPSMFTELWENARQKYINMCERNKKEMSLTLPEIVSEIWTPVYQESKQIVQELSSLTMPLMTLKKYAFPKVKDKLEKSLNNLCCVVDRCMKLEGKEEFGKEWVREAVDKMLKYYTLCTYADAAETFKKLKDVLKLTGDFSIVKTLSEQVSILHIKVNEPLHMLFYCIKPNNMYKIVIINIMYEVMTVI